MDVWLLCGALLPGLCVGLGLGSHLSGRVWRWVARCGFVFASGIATAILYWTYELFDQSVITLLIAVFVLYAAVLIASTNDLVEDNCPPTPAMREEILAFHAAADLRYRREPHGKRAFDVIMAAVGIALTLPLWFLVALLIWFEEPGPIFFTKNSVGRGGMTFRELKFRTMRVGAEQNTGPVVATFKDPRALAVGRVFRRWHLDEMPELVNVLAGTMSVVGPRPLRALVVREALDEVPGFEQRHTVRPGIACTAQIEKCHVELAERLYKDMAYIQRMSLAYDVRLLVRAVVTTVRGQREPAPLPEVVVTAETMARSTVEIPAGYTGITDPSNTPPRS